MFKYRYKDLILEQGNHILPLKEIAQNQNTPFYLYDLQGLRDWYAYFKGQTHDSLKVFFAMKSNSNKDILKTFQKLGSGVDVVSGGEATLAQKLGFKPRQIVFSGVGKNQKELEMAISQNFLRINVESKEELKKIVEVAQHLKKQACISLRLNPNIDAKTHPYITTGLKDNKFGLEESELPQLLKIIKKHPDQIALKGLSMHIGSQISQLKSLYEAIAIVKNIYNQLKKQGYPLEDLNIGGGLKVDYSQEGLEQEKKLIKDFGNGIKDLFKNFSGSVFIEPGRFLVARFGVLCAQVLYVKKTPHKKFIILNSGMNHFLRPSLYGAKHRILPFVKDQKTKETYDVVGPICETADTFAKDYKLSPVKPQDWMAVADTGAYGFVMSNLYNLQTPIQEISFDKGKKL